MPTTLFQTQPDIHKDDRDALINYLKNHARYYTMNSWNRATSYAHNVKLYNLNLDNDAYEKASAFLFTDEIDTSEYQMEQEQLIRDFREDTNYDITFNGRSGGYLVLLDTEYNINTGTLQVYPGRSIDANEDFEDWDINALYDRYVLVNKFDKLCDDLRDLLIDYATNGTIKETTYYVPKTIRQLIRKA